MFIGEVGYSINISILGSTELYVDFELAYCAFHTQQLLGLASPGVRLQLIMCQLCTLISSLCTALGYAHRFYGKHQDW